MPFVNVNQKPLFYTLDEQDKNSRTTHTTLFLHGLGSSSCFYKTIIPGLTASTRCIALDYPGSGLSSLGSSAQSIESIAEEAVELLESLDVKEEVVVVGHSMGGIVASYIAAIYPDRVKGVVLLGPVNPMPSLAEVFARRIETVKKDGLEALANTIPIGATGSNAGYLQHAFVRTLILGTSLEGYMSLCKVIAEAKEPNYGSIKIPLLILAGSDDKTAPLASSGEVLKKFGTSEEQKKIKVLEGVGHWHCVEDPGNVGHFIESFLVEGFTN